MRRSPGHALGKAFPRLDRAQCGRDAKSLSLEIIRQDVADLCLIVDDEQLRTG
jgi:hypothetical protein